MYMKQQCDINVLLVLLLDSIDYDHDTILSTFAHCILQYSVDIRMCQLLGSAKYLSVAGFHLEISVWGGRGCGSFTHCVYPLPPLTTTDINFGGVTEALHGFALKYYSMIILASLRGQA